MNKRYLLAIGFAFLLIGCSGKVQTNPLPEDKVYHLPKSQRLNSYKVSDRQKENFDAYAKKFFSKRGMNEILEQPDDEIEAQISQSVDYERSVREQKQQVVQQEKGAKKSGTIWSVGYERAKNSY